MSTEFEKQLDFNSDTFSEMKTDMNFVLQRLIGNMQEKGATEGSLTLKIDVSMVKEFIPNYSPDVKGETREVSKPQFKHKVTSAVKISDEKSGRLNNEMELVMDEETGIYKLVPIANTTQRSIFDSDFQAKEETDGEESVEGGTYIEGTSRPLLPGPDTEVIDGEFREVSTDEPQGAKKCITGWSRYGVCSCCGNGGVQCCKDCEESCNGRCGWIDKPYIPEGEEVQDITDEFFDNKDNDGEAYSYEEPEDE